MPLPTDPLANLCVEQGAAYPGGVYVEGSVNLGVPPELHMSHLRFVLRTATALQDLDTVIDLLVANRQALKNRIAHAIAAPASPATVEPRPQGPRRKLTDKLRT